MVHVNDPKNIIDQKKSDMNLGKLQYNNEYLSLCGFSNRLYITSNDNNPINLIKIDSKYLKNCCKETNNIVIQKQNENLSNNIIINPNINHNENKSDINFGIFKNNNNIEPKCRKDSLVSDISNYGNLGSYNSEFNMLINAGIL